MSLTKEELMNDVYNAGLITLGSVGVVVASKKYSEITLEFQQQRKEFLSWWQPLEEER